MITLQLPLVWKLAAQWPIATLYALFTARHSDPSPTEVLPLPVTIERALAPTEVFCWPVEPEELQKPTLVLQLPVPE